VVSHHSSLLFGSRGPHQEDNSITPHGNQSGTNEVSQVTVFAVGPTQHPSTSLLDLSFTTTDVVLALTALALLAWEFTMDNQQFAFHAWKHGMYDARAHWPGACLVWTKADAACSFCMRSLWSWSQNPNFFAKQSFWVCCCCVPFSAYSLHITIKGRAQSHPSSLFARFTVACPCPQRHAC